MNTNTSFQGPNPGAVLPYINVGHAFSHLFMLIYPTAVLTLEGAWGLGYAELLPLGFVGYLLFGVAALPAGWLGDKWSSSGMMAVFFLGTGLSSILTGFALSPWMLAGGLTAIGLFASIYHPVGIAWLVGANERPGRALGINGVYGALGTGGAAILTGILADLLGWRAAFIVPGVICLGLGVLFTSGVLKGRLHLERAAFRAGSARASAEQARRGLLLLFGAIIFAGIIFQMASVGMPKIFQDRLGEVVGLSATAAGTLVSLVYAVSALGQIAGGHLADRFDERHLYAASYALQVGILILAAATGSLVLVVLVALAVSLQTGSQPIENCLLARYTPDSWRATVFGMKFVMALGLSAIGVPMVAAIYGASGAVTGVFLAMAACAVIPAVVSLLLPRARPTPALAAEPAE